MKPPILFPAKSPMLPPTIPPIIGIGIIAWPNEAPAIDVGTEQTALVTLFAAHLRYSAIEITLVFFLS